MSERFGLMTRASEPVTLKGVKVVADILGRCARVRVIQIFRNDEEKSVEALYKFPLPEGAAVHGFEVWVNGRTIRGELEERDK